MHIRRSMVGLLFASTAGTLPANTAADTVSLIVSDAEAGVTAQPARGAARPLKPGSVLNTDEQLCSPHRGAKVTLRRSDRSGDFVYVAQQAGCRRSAEILEAMHGADERSDRHALRRLLTALTMDRQSKHPSLTAAARGGQIENALCKVTAHTDWLVIDQLGGVIVPVVPGAGGRLTPLTARGDAAGASIAIEEKGGELRLPALGVPGQVFELAIKGGLDEPCRLRLRIVDGAQDAVQAPPSGVGVDPNEVAWRTAMHALRLVDVHGRAWTLEALRQVAPYRAVADADRAYAYLATPNAECANREGSDIPVVFDMPWLRAPRSLLSEGRRSVFLVWRGGLPPFRVSLQREGAATPIAELSDLKMCEVFLPVSDLTTGRHVLTITDHAGAQLVDQEIFAVAPARRPFPPALPEAPAQPAWLSAAQWLAEQEDGAWRFEALQDVAARLGEAPEAQAWIHRGGRSATLSEVEP